MNNILKDNGTFICSTYNKNSLTPRYNKSINKYHIKELYYYEFIKLLNIYFKQISINVQFVLKNSISRFIYMLYHTLWFLFIKHTYIITNNNFNNIFNFFYNYTKYDKFKDIISIKKYNKNINNNFAYIITVNNKKIIYK